jgi:hypothetical protein
VRLDRRCAPAALNVAVVGSNAVVCRCVPLCTVVGSCAEHDAVHIPSTSHPQPSTLP